MIQAYKILTGKVRVNSDSLLPRCEFKKTRGHSAKLEKRRARLNVRKYSFSYRVTDSWNSLPEYIVKSETVNKFKDNIDKHWANRRYSLHQNQHTQTGMQV